MKTLGIIKETKNKWERRVPLNPQAVQELIQKGFEVVVQPSKIRIYKDEEYLSVGAKLSFDLSNSDLIIGVKEIPLDDLIPEKAYLFFSHTIKGQKYNMPMLQRILDRKITLLDYEKIEDGNNNRLVFFGNYAGYAGMVDTLHGLGQRLKQQYKVSTPFLKIKPSYQYLSVQDAIEHLKVIGKEIEEKGLPEKIIPFNIFLFGYGHVSEGCQKILSALPIQKISPVDLEELSHIYENNKIYLSIFEEKHMVECKDGTEFDLQDYYQNNSKYQSKLKQVLPFCSIYVNAIYWTSECPVFLPNSYLKEIQNNNPKLIIVGDISCDIEGSVQATKKITWPDNPVFIYDALKDQISDGYNGKGFAIMAVDNLPCEFSKEASDCFSKSLMPFLEKMLQNDYSKLIADSDLPEEIKSACIAHQGKLERDYQYLEKFLNQ